jgi:hypothetical protein
LFDLIQIARFLFVALQLEIAFVLGDTEKAIFVLLDTFHVIFWHMENLFGWAIKYLFFGAMRLCTSIFWCEDRNETFPSTAGGPSSPGPFGTCGCERH